MEGKEAGREGEAGRESRRIWRESVCHAVRGTRGPQSLTGSGDILSLPLTDSRSGTRLSLSVSSGDAAPPLIMSGTGEPLDSQTKESGSDTRSASRGAEPRVCRLPRLLVHSSLTGFLLPPSLLPRPLVPSLPAIRVSRPSRREGWKDWEEAEAEEESDASCRVPGTGTRAPRLRQEGRQLG